MDEDSTRTSDYISLWTSIDYSDYKKNRILKEAMDTKWYVHEYEDWSGVSNYLRTLTTNFGSKKLNKNIAL